jgi:hypothetical protein
VSERQCQFVTKTPVYMKQIGDMKIDPSEWEHKDGAFFRYNEVRCQYIADEGQKLCPRHILESAEARP